MRRLTRLRAPRGALLPLAAITLGVFRMALPERSLVQAGPRAIWDAGFAILLAVVIGLLATAAGRWTLESLGLEKGATWLDTTVFAFGAGSGLLSLTMFALGSVGVLHPTTIWGVLVAGLILARKQAATFLSELRSGGAAQALWKHRSPFERTGVVLGTTIFLFAVVQALAPAWDYDGLMYHLQAPRLFLQAGRLLPLPQIWQANGPLNVEMLYTIGLAFGSDSAARLLHLGFTLGLVLTTLAMGRRYLGSGGGWLAAAVLLGTPILAIWGSLAFADAGWALYEVLAVYAVLLWREKRDTRWLVASGVLAGLGLGSKYLALGMIAPLGMSVLFTRSEAGSRRRWRDCAVLLGAAALFACPWYLKNIAWFRNPVYPFLVGGPEWPLDRLQMLMAYLGSFGTGKTLADFVALPWNLYARHEAFGTFMTTIEVPGLAFLVVILAPFLRLPAPIRTLGLIALLRFGFWALGSQQIRFLLPLFPLLAVLAASVLLDLGARLRGRTASLLGAGLSLGLLGASLAYQLIFLADTRPSHVVAGLESKDAFLERVVYDYAAMRHIRENLPAEALVFLAWDGQSYYCDNRCLPDAEQSQWTQLVAREPGVEEIRLALQNMGVTHILVDLEGINFLLRHDPTGLHVESWRVLVEEYAPMCLEAVQTWEEVALFRMPCG